VKKQHKYFFSKEVRKRISENENRILCPECENKTRLQKQADTELKNFPLYCSICRQESLIDAMALKVTMMKRLEVKMQS
jgi:transcription elongation factor Elf1